MRYVLRFWLIACLCSLSFFVHAQQKEGEATRDDIRKEALEMRAKLDAYIAKRLNIDPATDTGILRQFSGLSQKYLEVSAARDSLILLSQAQQLRIDSLFGKLKGCQSGNRKPGPIPDEKSRGHVFIAFSSNSSLLNDEAKRQLSRLLEELKGMELWINGFADSYGEEDYNKLLSEKRAAEVKAYLVAKGWNGNQIHSEGRGECAGSKNGNMQSGRQCRVVEVIFRKN